jgi:hypothetical protein
MARSRHGVRDGEFLTSVDVGQTVRTIGVAEIVEYPFGCAEYLKGLLACSQRLLSDNLVMYDALLH